DILKRHARVINLDSETDYRMRRLARLPVYVTPLGPQAERQMDEAWAAVTGGRVGAPEDIAIKGRNLRVPRAAGRAARFDFADLCDAPLAAREYIAIAERYDTIFVDNVPVLDQSRRNPAKRFILFIDTMYDMRRRLILSAEAPPDEL